MSCVNTNSQEYKSLVKSLDRREQFVARAVLSKYLTDNNTDVLPDFIELKGLISDLYNTTNGGTDYRDFYDEVKTIFKNLIPSLSDKELEERVKFVDKLELMRLRNGQPVLTSFINNTVYVATSLLKDRGTQAYTDVRHEVFHTIFNNFLSPSEQETLAESFKRWKPEFSSIQDKEELEETMADSFESYRFNKKQSIFKVIKDFFEDILKFFGIVNTGYTDIKKLFDDVEGGRFTRNYLNDSLVTRDKTILSNHPDFSTDLDLFLQAKAFMLNNLNELMFPENNKNLSEVYNGGLFLKQDYNSPLFKNNKDVFKLGLTKESSLDQLQVRIKALKNDKTTDPQLAKVVKVLSKPKVFKDLFDYLQPYSVAEVNAAGELTLKSQVEEDPTITVLDEEDQGVNPGNLEIGSKELINPTTKISEVVKDFLSSVSYETTPGNFVSIDPGAGFIALLNMLGSLYGNTSMEDNLQSLKDNYQSTTKGNQTKALYNKLTELHENVLNKDRISLNIKGVSTNELNAIKNQMDNAGIKYEVNKDHLNLIIPETLKIENKGTNSTDNTVVFSFNRFAEGKQSFLETQKPGESNKRFVERIAAEADLPSFVVAKLFKYNEDRNTIAEVTKVANSLRKLSPKFVKVSTSRVDNPDGPGSSNVTSYAYINRVNEFKSSSSLASSIRERLGILPARQSFIDAVKKYDKVKGSSDRTAQRNILKDILINKLQVLGEDDFSKIANRDVTSLLNNLEKIVKFVPEITTSVEVENIKDNKAFLRQTSNLGDSLVKYTYEKNNPTSFQTSTSNKSKWENVMPNTAYKIFKNIQDYALRDKDKKIKPLPFLRNSFNNYLKYNPIIDHNYSDGTFNINESMFKYNDEDFISDHQETYFENSNSNYEKPPIPFSKESPREWINRNFLVMFNLPILESLTQNKKNVSTNLSYFQQKFQPESAPNVSVIKMGVTSATQLENNIASMIIQEAYMAHKFSNSDRGNLSKNTKKSYLPGLEGSTYFINNGENVFFDGAGNLNKEFGTIKDGKLVINTSNKTIKNLTETIMNNLDASLDQFVDVAINEKSTLDGSMLADVYQKIESSYPTNYKLSEEELSTLKGFGIDSTSDVEGLKEQENFEKQREVLKKAMAAYYLNSYVNGYFMNQMSSGATQNYKNPLDEIKRQAGVNAMNDTGLIDDKHGMPNTYRNIVIAAANNFYGKSHEFAGVDLLKRFFANKQNEVADAQSWDIPEYKEMLRKSFGKSVDMGVITKDVHFEINENGGTDYRKTSSAELTNELVQKNKTLRDLRFALTFQPYLDSLTDSKEAKTARAKELYNKLIDNGSLANVDEYMEYQDLLKAAAPTMIHKASFESAIKGSKPSKMSQFIKDKETGTFNFTLEPTSVLNLNSSYNGIQQAVRHRYLDSFISHFTQLTYLTGLNRTATSIKNSKILTNTLAKFSKSGMYDTLFDYRMAYSEDKLLKANLRSKKEFINDLKKKLDLPGNERLVGLLNTKGISMNNPLFSEKLMQTFFNSLTKKTVNPKHPGGSFVLQSEFGFESNKILTENSLKIPELKIQDGKILYAECYLPEMYSDQLKNKDLIYYNNDEYNKMFGFRIPSSDLHSSVPLKVIGYYPSNSHDNVVVIPSAVTALHGSDFDVDKLFVVRQGVFGVSDEDKDPKTPDQTTDETSNKREFKTKFQTDNKVIAQKGVKFGYTVPDAQYTEQNQIINFGDNKHVKVSNLEETLIDEKEKTQNRILSLEDKQSTLSKGASPKERLLNDAEHRKLSDEIKSLTNHLKTLKSVQKGLYSNTILDSVLDNINYSGENANDILFGITFDPVKGYEETSEYSQLARVFSDINKKKGVDDLLPERPKTYSSLDEALAGSPAIYSSVKQQLENNLGIDTTTKAGQEDLLSMVNSKLEDNWTSTRDEFLRRQRGSGNVNINRVEQHVNMHKETYMASGLVGLIANFSKGLAYAFHAISDGTNAIELGIAEDKKVIIDGVKIDNLTLENKDSVKNQELKSLALNAAIDHVKEQILNVLNVGNNTAKIFLASVSTKLTLHQTTMLMLQPAAKYLNSSNASTVSKTLASMEQQLLDKADSNKDNLSETDIASYEITTDKLEPFVQTSFQEILAKGDKKEMIQQLKVIRQLHTLNSIGEEISNISANLSIIQGLPYNLEMAYDKLKSMNKFIDIPKFYDKLTYNERLEYNDKGFKDDLKATKSLFNNVNMANNDNVLGALEAIKMQIDVTSEMFSENSVQMQFVINNILKSISNNSDPATMFTGENDQNLTFDTVKNMSTTDKYLKGKNTYIITKLIARNIFNFLTSGMNISYNDGNHMFSLGIQDQKLNVIKNENSKDIYLGPVRSFLGQFLMKGKDIQEGHYNGDDYVISQINPAWRLKPLSLIKKQNKENKFLRNLGIDFNFRDKVNVMTFNSDLVNSAENMAEIEQAVNQLNSLNNIYVTKSGNDWVELPANEHPYTPEMNEVIFNILKSSLYTDQFKFSSSKVTNVIPTKYFKNIFSNLDTLTKGLILYDKSSTGEKYYKDYSDSSNESNNYSAISNIKENLFINTIMSVPTVLPNIAGKKNADGSPIWTSKAKPGILANGNIYDLFIDASVLEDAPVENTQDDQARSPEGVNDEKTDSNTNPEIEADISEEAAKADLANTFKKNPSFLVEQSIDDKSKYDLFMKVGSTGSKEENNLRHFYKKVANINNKITNNSFDTNLLLNRYKIKDYYNPKRFAIPVRPNVDLTQNTISLKDITISSFLINSKPKNAKESDESHLKNLIAQVKEVSLFDGRNLDRIGLKAFSVKSFSISSDKSSISFELEALPRDQQISMKKFNSPLDVQADRANTLATRDEKLAKINNTFGAKRLTQAQAQEMTDAQLNEAYDEAIEIDETKGINKVLKEKSKNCK